MRCLQKLVLASVLSLCACASTASKNDEPVTIEPELISELPDTLESFEYQGYRHFDDDTDGFTFRYTNERKHRMADVYVYPVAEENNALEHKELVLGSTRATLEAIGEAVKEGLYKNFNVVGAATQAAGFRTTARVEATYLQHNLASYTLVYQSEYDGTLMKIRVSMPDNNSNRNSAEWDRFAEEMFDTILRNLNQRQHQLLSADVADRA